jgi:hypothetical protein
VVEPEIVPRQTGEKDRDRSRRGDHEPAHREGRGWSGKVSHKRRDHGMEKMTASMHMATGIARAHSVPVGGD